MGLIMKLPKEDNTLYADFESAYWSIDDIVFSNGQGMSYTSFCFNAYASREAKMKNLQTVDRTLNFGGAVGLAYSPLLHTWEATFPTIDLFSNGIPVLEKDQKNVLYAFVKQCLGLENCEDVLEE